jgi:hypothetical protein
MLHNFVNRSQWPYKGLTYPSFPTPSSFIANKLNVGPIPILLFAMAPLGSSKASSMGFLL